MKTIGSLVSIATLSLSLSTAALAGPSAGASAGASGKAAPTKVQGGVLTNLAGMTLYTFDKDQAGAGKSVCNDQCAGLWPPLFAAAGDKGAAGYSVITRDDGTLQWAYKGKPLYLWVKDAKPGDKTGDRVANAWTLARP